MKNIIGLMALGLTLFSHSALAEDYSQRDLFNAMNMMTMSWDAYDIYTGRLEENTEKDGYKDLGIDFVPVSLKGMRETIESNELAAEIKYDKPFAVTGKITKITRLMGKPIVKLEPKKDKARLLSSVSAFFDDRYTADLAKLEKGKVLTIACKEWSYSMTPSFSKCQLMPHYFETYNKKTDPFEIIEQGCKKPDLKDSTLRARIFWSKLKKEIDTFDPKVVSELTKKMLESDNFLYLGFDSKIDDEKEYPEFVKAKKQAISEMENDTNSLTAEDC